MEGERGCVEVWEKGGSGRLWQVVIVQVEVMMAWVAGSIVDVRGGGGWIGCRVRAMIRVRF